MSAEGLKFQLFLRGFDVDDPENELPTRAKGKGGGKTTKPYYVDVANNMIQTGAWQRKIEEELLKSRIKEYRNRHSARGSEMA